jgi:hypothetical protein
MGKKIRKIAKKGKKLAKKVAKSGVAREIARRQTLIVAEAMQKLSQKLRVKARKRR